MKMEHFNNLHREIMRLLRQEHASYANPVDSDRIGKMLNVTPSYVRSQITGLVKRQWVGVRRGNGGGYYLCEEVCKEYVDSGG